MARISYRAPADIDDPQCRAWLEAAMEAGKPGPDSNRFGRMFRA